MIAASTIITLIAQAGGQPLSVTEQLIQMAIPLGLIFLVFYFVMWRPQAKRQQEHQTYLNALKSGDEVVTAGGILGTIKAVDESVVTIEVGKGTKIKVLKSQIRGSRASLAGGGDEGSDS